jgi:hypothetical protein
MVAWDGITRVRAIAKPSLFSVARQRHRQQRHQAELASSGVLLDEFFTESHKNDMSQPPSLLATLTPLLVFRPHLLCRTPLKKLLLIFQRLEPKM